MTRTERISERLHASFAPTWLEVIDDSASHAGHAGAVAGGQTHFNVLMVTDRFAGQSRVMRSRAVHAVLSDEFASGLHALALTLRTVSEQAASTG